MQGKKEHLSQRLATTDDVETISALVNSAYRGESSKEGWTTEADILGGQRTDPDSLRKELTKPGRQILMFYRQDELVGCVYLQKRECTAYLGMLSVAPRLQAAGIGKAALALAEKWALENWGIGRIEMTVIRRRTELLEWYLRRGYSDTGRRESFPSHDSRFGIPKVDDLEMAILEKTLC